MNRLLSLSIVVIAVGVMTFASSRAASVVVFPNHNYSLDLHGTPGVRLRLLLVTKAADANPARREEIVVLPAKIDFKATLCYAWADTLPEGGSGKDGDSWTLDLIRDGRKVTSCQGSIKSQNNRSGGVFDDR